MAGFELFPKHFLFLFTSLDSFHVVDIRVHGAFVKSVRVQLAALFDGSDFCFDFGFGVGNLGKDVVEHLKTFL